MKTSNKSRIRNARDGYVMTLPLVAGCLIFYAYPFLLVIRHSLMKGSGNSQAFVGMKNYEDVVGNSIFQLAFGNTMKFLLVALPLILIVSYAIALLVKNQVQRHQTLKSVILMPYILVKYDQK